METDFIPYLSPEGGGSIFLRNSGNNQLQIVAIKMKYVNFASLVNSSTIVTFSLMISQLCTFCIRTISPKYFAWTQQIGTLCEKRNIW